jgi:hypothetical protein
MPRSYKPVKYTSNAVTTPPPHASLYVVSSTQYTLPPTPEPSSRGRKYRRYVKVKIQAIRAARSSKCSRSRALRLRYCRRREDSRIKRLRYICGGEEGWLSRGSLVMLGGGWGAVGEGL